MKKVIYGLTMMTMVVACSSNPKIDYPYTFVNEKIEKDSKLTDITKLYSCGEKPNSDTLKLFCKEFKDRVNNKGFSYIVFFDTKENAGKFPYKSFRTMNEIDTATVKHIKAYYEYNSLNGYSKLTIYEDNMYESAPQSENIN